MTWPTIGLRGVTIEVETGINYKPKVNSIPLLR